MTKDELRDRILASLSEIAPEIDVSELESNVDFREQFDIDSMDLLNFIIAIHERTDVDIPESDYPKLVTLDGCVSYLSARLRLRNSK